MTERMFVTDEGDGDPILMLPGLGGTTSMFQPQAETLARSYRVIRVDPAGAGRSPLRGRPSVAGWAQDLLALLDEGDLDAVTVVAHSLGTLIAAEIARRRPGLVRALVDLGPVRAQPEQVKQSTRDRAATVREDGMGAVVDGVLAVAVSDTARRDQPVVSAFVRESLLGQDPEGYAASCEALADAQEPDWAALTMPVWLVAGDADRLAAPALVDAIAERVPHATRVVVPDAGHWITVETPELVTNIVRDAVGV